MTEQVKSEERPVTPSEIRSAGLKPEEAPKKGPSRMTATEAVALANQGQGEAPPSKGKGFPEITRIDPRVRILMLRYNDKVYIEGKPIESNFRQEQPEITDRIIMPGGIIMLGNRIWIHYAEQDGQGRVLFDELGKPVPSGIIESLPASQCTVLAEDKEIAQNKKLKREKERAAELVALQEEKAETADEDVAVEVQDEEIGPLDPVGKMLDEAEDGTFPEGVPEAVE